MQTNWKRIFLIGLIGSLSVAALFAIGVFVAGAEFGHLEVQILTTALLVGLCSLSGLGNAVLLLKRPKARLAITGIITSFAAFVWSFLCVWEVAGLKWSIFGGNGPLRISLALLVLSLSAAHASLMLSAKRNGSPIERKTLETTLWFIGIVAGMLLSSLYGYRFAESDLFHRATAAFAVLDALGTLVTLLLMWLSPSPSHEDLPSENSPVMIEVVKPPSAGKPDAPTRWKSLFLRGLIGSLSTAALFSIGVLLFGGHFNDFDRKILATSALVACCSMTGLANAVLLAKDRRSVLKTLLGLAGIGFSLVALFGLTMQIWEIGKSWGYWDYSEAWKFFGALGILALSTAQASLLVSFVPARQAVILIVRSVTLLFIGIVAAMFVEAIYVNHQMGSEFFMRKLGVYAVLDVLGTLVTPLLKWVVPSQPPSHSI